MTFDEKSAFTEEEKKVVGEFFDSFGKYVVLPESLQDAAIPASGSSSAFVYVFIEAMADAAVCCGIPRDTAYKMTAQTVLGAAKMVLETGEHPGKLKDNVCSPGGTTIAGVAALFGSNLGDGWILFVGLVAPGLIWFNVVFTVLWMIFGLANKNNANDNTSGVVTLLEILRTLPENQRNKVCFVLFDLEEAGLIGSVSYRKAHKKATDHQLVLNLDCVGDGDHLLIFPTKALKQNRKKCII